MAKISLILNEILESAGETTFAESRLVKTALLCELAGADGVVVKIREDGLGAGKAARMLKDVLDVPLAVIVASDDKAPAKAIEIKPDMVVLQSLTPESSAVVTKCQVEDIVVGIIIRPEIDQVKEAARTKADYVVFDTTAYCNAKSLTERLAYIDNVAKSSALAQRLSMGTIVSGKLTPSQLGKFAEIENIGEFFLGSQVAFAAIGQGLQKALQRFKEVL